MPKDDVRASKLRSIGIRISEDSNAESCIPIAMAVHYLTGLPVTMRSKNKPGVRIERGTVLDTEYDGPMLQRVFEENRVIRGIPSTGQYKGVPIVASPIRDAGGTVVAVIGMVDVVGSLDIGTLFYDYAHVLQQVSSYIEKSRK
ncbi:DUF2111 domain-containing protein [Methermicoccus shengliensis]|uniref:DUF2111 domain-containing protein n=1 Tax=Methermicoccus shengliensis TaxID=660064 RepID=A0A832RWY5_9EURY|nr:DUF2111 domain-containing protein [Methermicoccus shengliensis]KUK04856.1 MAG: hypothetical protein XD46_0387 [Euryarchaeota archaeon 55_53]KUK30484.1 MAG: hypothetical protein XD62_0454 [Methanosarcinales archeaon 56_1174]MDI3487896.1 hypothetical protein [Methanosarcinales archaeon]MDN5295362.1 hypothetical protein [Methanosarcinales archaeon]HIH69552.1 DUF2111 domain-containing protein [Methermicoccus shengliensis]